jgi:hypothetical protein
LLELACMLVAVLWNKAWVVEGGLGERGVNLHSRDHPPLGPVHGVDVGVTRGGAVVGPAGVVPLGQRVLLLVLGCPDCGK